MKSSLLHNLFIKKISIDEFKAHIDSEVAEYKKNIKKRGTSSSIYLDEDYDDFKVTKKNVALLCSNFLERKIDKWELNYIAEALMFANYEKMLSSETLFALESLTDPEYEKLVNDRYVKNILEELLNR